MPLPMPGMSVTFSFGVFQDGGDRIRDAFDDAGGVAVAADAEGILAGDFHQVGGFVEELGDGAVFHLTIVSYIRLVSRVPTREKNLSRGMAPRHDGP